MKKLLLFLLAWPLLGQAATPVGLMGLFARCPGSGPAFVMWTGSSMQCISLPSNVSLAGTVLAVTAPSAPPAAPQWQVETVNLSSTALGSTTISYTPLKNPINGMVLYFYNSNNFFQFPVSGAVSYAGAPLTFTLPIGWSSSDSIQIVYQSQ